MTVLELRPADGAEVWERVFRGQVDGGEALAVTLDAAGDAVVAGTTWLPMGQIPGAPGSRSAR